jgi:hypothetical protein
VDRRGCLLTSQLVGTFVGASFIVGCGGVNPSTAWQTHCPRGSYAPQSLDEWFRTSAEVIQGRRGPQMEGYIYNDYFAGAEQMLVGVEQLSSSGQSGACATVWVAGSIPPRNRAYFVTPAPDPGTHSLLPVINRSASGVWIFRGQLTFTCVTAR